jgi:large conductance mechanosensitive channel
MGVLKEFKEFAVRGNVVDLAVGLIVGAAFGKIVSSLVGDIIMPPIGKLMGNVNFSDLFISLEPSKTAGISSLARARETGAAIIAYGAFLNAIIDFVIIAFCVFLLVKAMNRLNKLKKADEPAPVVTKECPYCISTIPIKATRCAQCTSELR